jgi:P27 family predicted phage terminase small subunit
MATKRPPKPPQHLRGEAADLWRRTLDEYEFTDAASLAILRQACETLARIREVQAVIAADGLTVEGSKGQRRPHPLLATEDMLRRSLLAHARSLRLTAVEA